MARLCGFLLGAAVALQASAASLSYGPSSYAPPGAFPTSLYPSYYNNPTATAAQPQPVISDPVLHKVYPPGLTDPKNIPRCDNPQDPHPLPPRASDEALLQAAKTQVQWLLASPAFTNNAKFLSLAAPEQGPLFFVFLCQQFKLYSACNTTFGATTLGPVLTQVLANADVVGYDGQLICQNFFSGACPLPPTPPLNLTDWFAKPKPTPLRPPRTPSGKRLKVLHLSDFHIDPQANCTSGLCCRTNNHNTNSPNETVLPAHDTVGSYGADSPFSLAAAVLEAIPVLAGTEKTGFAWTLYTGDLVSHDSENQLSRDYVTPSFDLFKRMLNPGPVYAALGNHDSYNQAQDAPHSLGGELGEQFSWNYDHVAALWKLEQWLPQSAVAQARAHYAGYSVQRTDGLRVISLNSDIANLFNYINLSQIDNSGMLRFLTDELQDAEDEGDRVWIIGHVPTGWDGGNALEAPSNLCGVARFSPHVIANIFWGHLHEDVFSIYYANNATNLSAETALATSWMGPSITPLTNLNSGFRVYEVDSATFEILDAHTWRSDVQTYPSLDAQTTFEFTWGVDDPLNATWWHLVTERTSAVSPLTFTDFQGKQSVFTSPCTGDCIDAKICYMRSGSTSISIQNCKSGFGSVQ
ncbi:Metallo-dependent phosphatase-like protein [Russula brevipes]|nr:Metallo-dependent phosphatase-like protein [Russula brevipes]